MIVATSPDKQVFAECSLETLKGHIHAFLEHLKIDPSLSTLLAVNTDPTKIQNGMLAKVMSDGILWNKAELQQLYAEAFSECNNVETAYKATALRLTFVLIHEKKHLDLATKQKAELGFVWPLSCLQDEAIAISKEVSLYQTVKLDSKLTGLLEQTRPTSQYGGPPGIARSMIESFDHRLNGALTTYKQGRDPFLQFCRAYYLNAIDLTQDRKTLELELRKLQKFDKHHPSDLSEQENKNLEDALRIVSDPKKFESLRKWYQSQQEQERE